MIEKKNGHPTQPGSHSVSYQRRRRKPKTILQRLTEKCKRMDWRVPLALLMCLLLVFVLVRCAGKSENGQEPAEDPQETETAGPDTQPEPTQEAFIFRDGEGCPVCMEALTAAWAAEAGMEKRYAITDEERYELAAVVMAEAGGEPFAGMVAVAQCMLQACEDDGIRPLEVVERYKYSTRRPTPSCEALAAVGAVFDFGHVAVNEPIKYFYAPRLASGEWHESQVYVMTINNHKFFKEVTK